MNIGDTYSVKHIVRPEESALAIGSGGLQVYSTPSMIALMEKSAYSFALENGIQSVGTKVCINHLRACLPGTELTAECRLVEMEGRRMTFEISVADKEGIIGEGKHERFSIDPERFMARLA